MPLPKPSSNETRSVFVARCMSNPVMQQEFPKNDQRLAVCYNQWRQKSAKSKIVAAFVAFKRALGVHDE